jgi:hypothetical protein
VLRVFPEPCKVDGEFVHVLLPIRAHLAVGNDGVDGSWLIQHRLEVRFAIPGRISFEDHFPQGSGKAIGSRCFLLHDSVVHPHQQVKQIGVYPGVRGGLTDLVSSAEGERNKDPKGVLELDLVESVEVFVLETMSVRGNALPLNVSSEAVLNHGAIEVHGQMGLPPDVGKGRHAAHQPPLQMISRALPHGLPDTSKIRAFGKYLLHLHVHFKVIANADRGYPP